MRNVNKAILLGNVTNDPETKQTAAGQAVCTFGLATSREWKDANGEKQKQTEFHHLVAWGKLGEFCGRYVQKGKSLYVEGHLRTGSWKNPQGVTLHRTEVVLDDVVLLGAGTKKQEAAQEAAEAPAHA